MSVTNKSGSKLRTFLKVSGFLCLGLIAVTAVVLWFLIDTGRVKHAIENLVTQATERPLRINGELDFSIGKNLTVHATDVQWLNPEWSSEADMLLVDEARVSVNLASLLEGPVVITEAEVYGATLVFEWANNGGFNWDLRNPTADPNDITKTTDNEAVLSLPLLLDKANVTNVTIHFLHPALTEKLTIEIPQASQQQDSENRLVISADTLIDDRNVALEGRIGPFPQLIAAGAINYKFDITGPYASLLAKGSFANLAELTSPVLNFSYEAPDAEDLLKSLKLKPITKGAIDIEANIESGVNSLTASATGYFGEFKLDTKLITDRLNLLNEFNLVIDSSGPSIGALGQIGGITSLPDAPYTLSVKADRIPEGLKLSKLSLETKGLSISGSGIAHKLPELRDFELTLEMKGNNFTTVGEILSLEQVPPLPFKLKAEVTGNGLETNDSLSATYSLGGTTGDIAGTLTEDKDFEGSSFSVSLNSADIRELTNTYNIRLARPAPLKTQAEFTLLNQRVQINGLDASFDDNQLIGKGVINLDNSLPLIEADARLVGGNLQDSVYLLTSDSSTVLPANPYEVAGRITLNGTRIDLKTSEAQIGNNSLGFDGWLDLKGETVEIDAEVKASGKNLARLFESQNISGIPEEPFNLSANLQLSDAGISLDKLAFSIANNHLSGYLNSGWPENPKLIQFDIEARGENLRKTLPDISGYIPPAVPFNIQTKGQVDSSTINLKRFEASLGADTSIKLDGRIEYAPIITAQQVSFFAKGSSLTDIGEISNRKLARLPFSVSATMSGNQNNLSIDDFQADVGSSNLDGTVNLDFSAQPHVELTLTSKRLEPGLLFDATDKDLDTAQLSSSDSSTETKRVFSDKPIDLSVLSTFNSNLSLKIDTLIVGTRIFQNVIVDANLKDGDLNTDKLASDTQDGNISGSFRLLTSGTKPSIAGDFVATNAIFSAMSMDGRNEDQLPRHRIDTSFSSSGESSQELAANLNGYAWIRGKDGILPTSKIDVLFGDVISEILTTLNPFATKSQHTELKCDGVYLEAKDGIIETAPALILQTDKISIVASGSVDLHTEKIDIGFKTSPLKGVGLSAGDIVNPFIKLGGTLSKPAIVADPKGTVIQGGAAVATLGVSILATSLWDRWISSPNGCQKMAQEARKVRQKIDPSNVPPPLDQP